MVDFLRTIRRKIHQGNHTNSPHSPHVQIVRTKCAAWVGALSPRRLVTDLTYCVLGGGQTGTGTTIWTYPGPWGGG
ncbi:hypothetical protein ACFXJ8_28810 [Nonomuraea sp. NPDC059194]|uniref:hypothetical protein n=1 Tax=Nonomuraea sp. NPDC059194 TaxID=3346764 RepID=UPI00368583A7